MRASSSTGDQDCPGVGDTGDSCDECDPDCKSGVIVHYVDGSVQCQSLNPSGTNNCPFGYGRLEGTCQKLECSSETPCPSGYSCFYGFCFPSDIETNCRGQICPPGQQCINGECLTGCGSSKSCPTRSGCLNDECLFQSRVNRCDPYCQSYWTENGEIADGCSTAICPECYDCQLIQLDDPVDDVPPEDLYGCLYQQSCECDILYDPDSYTCQECNEAGEKVFIAGCNLTRFYPVLVCEDCNTTLTNVYITHDAAEGPDEAIFQECIKNGCDLRVCEGKCRTEEIVPRLNSAGYSVKWLGDIYGTLQRGGWEVLPASGRFVLNERTSDYTTLELDEWPGTSGVIWVSTNGGLIKQISYHSLAYDSTGVRFEFYYDPSEATFEDRGACYIWFSEPPQEALDSGGYRCPPGHSCDLIGTNYQYVPGTNNLHLPGQYRSYAVVERYRVCDLTAAPEWCPRGEVLFLSVIDEDESYSSYLRQLDWQEFKLSNPSDYFAVLAVQTGNGTVTLPDGFDGIYVPVSVNANWQNALSSVMDNVRRVSLKIDNSGSMNTSTVQASRDSFVQYCAENFIDLSESGPISEEYIRWHLPQRPSYSVSIGVGVF